MKSLFFVIICVAASSAHALKIGDSVTYETITEKKPTVVDTDVVVDIDDKTVTIANSPDGTNPEVLPLDMFIEREYKASHCASAGGTSEILKTPMGPMNVCHLVGNSSVDDYTDVYLSPDVPFSSVKIVLPHQIVNVLSFVKK